MSFASVLPLAICMHSVLTKGFLVAANCRKLRGLLFCRRCSELLYGGLGDRCGISTKSDLLTHNLMYTYMYECSISGMRVAMVTVIVYHGGTL